MWKFICAYKPIIMRTEEWMLLFRSIILFRIVSILLKLMYFVSFNGVFLSSPTCLSLSFWLGTVFLRSWVRRLSYWMTLRRVSLFTTVIWYGLSMHTLCQRPGTTPVQRTEGFQGGRGLPIKTFDCNGQKWHFRLWIDRELPYIGMNGKV